MLQQPPRASVLRWLDRLWPTEFGTDPDAFDAAAAQTTFERVRALGRRLRWLPVRADGLEHVPAGPALLVMNHSGGTSIPDVWGFALAWYGRFGTARPLHPLAHEFVVRQPMTGRYFEKRGVLLARGDVARAALARGRDVLVLPGGDFEAWRPYWARHRVDFAGRRGYARLALQAGVPIVPVAHDGAHSTLVVLARGRRLARALQLHRIARAEIWPIHLSLPWGLAVGPLPHLPWPHPLRYQVGPPIAPGRVAEPTADDIDAVDAEVRATIQRMLGGLAAQGRQSAAKSTPYTG
jgi:1-acyl-sn-glycerol-3-phosphate acyltransferase